MRLRQTCFAVSAMMLAAVSFQAQACMSDADVAALFASYNAKTPAVNPEGLNDAAGDCSRTKLTAMMEKQGAKLVGYKAGLTNPAVQKRFNATQPVWGKLYENMLLKDGASIDAAFGARPLFEADMLVRVSSEAINSAKTPLDVLNAIDQIIPFIELPDLVVQAPPRLNGAAISAINVGARLGVLGAPIAAPAIRAEKYQMLDALRDMQVSMADGAGAALGGGKGSDILEHPLNAVVWLAQALAKEGQTMKVGQLISLGSFSPLVPTKAGMKVTVTYAGLPGAKPVTVSFK
ncbi:fumarylacetoacetate hydrolase [Variovorax sp. PCZ-1]|uniref:2-keto-4-pentenoate hydratase n=1 Tax=Variovorax sp. PCZ-1 TaxID=2835533 RepID=UPI001BCD3951|nr:fumarylacetoacetate hydrolase [Variovorax sp. PCZ-1]MBS7807322.1 fumarylacetoacetate hydrolase [Variovorax sp. PCZ-1]